MPIARHETPSRVELQLRAYTVIEFIQPADVTLMETFQDGLNVIVGQAGFLMSEKIVCGPDIR